MRKSIVILFLALCFCLGGSALAESWTQIKQPVDKPEGWQQIVADSPFALGAVRQVTTEDGLTYAQTDFGTYPSLDGSTVAVPMAMEFARQHLGLGEADLTGFVAFSTTHNAYVNLITGAPNGSPMLVTRGSILDDAHPVDLIIATEPSDEELALAEEHGVTLDVRPVCYDAFVFITHVDNPVKSLSVEQIRAIYSGEIADWSEVGGTAGWIAAYQRNKNSGSQTAMENLVMQGMPMSSQGTNIYSTSDMSGLIAAISEYDNGPSAIGYTYKYYIDALYQDDSIKILAIDGIYPTDENLRSGAYPFTTSYNAVIRAGDEEQAGGRFLTWMLTEEGQRCIQQAGYIPVMPLSGEEGGGQ